MADISLIVDSKQVEEARKRLEAMGAEQKKAAALQKRAYAEVASAQQRALAQTKAEMALVDRLAKQKERQAQSEIRAAQQVQAFRQRMAAQRAQEEAQAARDMQAQIARMDQLRAKYNPLAAASQLYAKSLLEINEAHKIGAITARQQEAALESLNTQYQQFNAGTARAGNMFVESTSRSTKGINGLGLAVQQTGYQVGDFLVQVQSGTNAFVAFGQQATQMAGLLTLAGGKMLWLGAGLSIAIPLITALAAGFMRTKDGAKASAGAVDKMRDSIAQMNLEAQAFDSGIFDITEQGVVNKIAELNIKIEERRALLERLGYTADEVGDKVSQMADMNTFQRWASALNPFGDSLNYAANSAAAAQAEINILNAELAEYTRLRDEAAAKEVAGKITDLSNELLILEMINDAGEDSVEVAQMKNYLQAEQLRLRYEEAGVNLDSSYIAEYEAMLNKLDAQERLNAEKEREAEIQTEYDDVVAALTEQIQLQEAILQYGADSAEVTALRAEQERNAAQAMYESAGLSGVLLSNAMALYDANVAVTNQVDLTTRIAASLSGWISAAAGATGGLAGGFSNAAGAASSIIGILNTIGRQLQALGGVFARMAAGAQAMAELPIIGPAIAGSMNTAATVFNGLSNAATNYGSISHNAGSSIALGAIGAANGVGGGGGGRGGGGGGGGGGGAAKLNEIQKAIEGVTDAISELELESKTLREQLDVFWEMGDAAEYWKKKQELLNAAREAGVEVTAELAAQIEDLATQYQAEFDEVEKLKDQLEDLNKLRERGYSILDDFADGLIDGDLSKFWDGFVSQGRDAFGDILKSAFRGDMTIQQSFGNAFSQIQAGFSQIGQGGFMGALGGIGQIASGIMPVVGAISTVANLISSFSSTRVLDQGLSGYLNFNPKAFDYEKKEKSTFWGWFKKTTTDTDFNPEVTKQLENSVARTVMLVKDLAKGIGGAAESLRKVKVDFKVKSGEQLEAKLKQYSDELAKAVLGPGKKFRELGETFLQTLERISVGLTGFNQIMGTFGVKLEKSLKGAAQAAGILNDIGGLQNLEAGFSSYFTNILTPDEQLKILSKQFNKGLKSFDINKNIKDFGGPEDFKRIFNALVDKGSLKKASGLMTLAPIFSQILGYGQEDGQGGFVNDQRRGMLIQLYTLQGKINKARNLEIQAIDKGNRKLQRRIWKLQDEQAVQDEKEGLEVRYLELLGDTNELRRRELEALDPTNRALQKMIWGLEDAQKAIENLKPEDFATKFLFQQAQGRARRGLSSTTVTALGTVVPAEVSEDAREIITSNIDGLVAIKTVLEDLRTLAIDQRRFNKRSFDIHKKWDVEGLPATRS